MIAALYVATNGPYFGLPGVEPYDIVRDAKTYRGPYPVIAHSPCERWGRYFSGGPIASPRRLLGDDNGCFANGLWAVRTFGGVLEHPEASHAFHYYGLPIPSWHGGWTEPDRYGGRSVCVAQGHYGHRARKMTWLYAVLHTYPQLKWGPSTGGLRMDAGFHSKEERAAAPKGRPMSERLSKRERAATPIEFRDLLIKMVREGVTR